MRRKSLTNSRPLDSDSIYEAYKDRCLGCCEVAYYTGLIITTKGKLHLMWSGLEIQKDLARHHLWSIGRRPDRVSNLLIVTRPMHDYFHGHLNESRVIGLVAKLRKAERNESPDEFTIAEIELCCGRKILGTIGQYEFDDPMVCGFQQECLRRLGEMATS